MNKFFLLFKNHLNYKKLYRSWKICFKLLLVRCHLLCLDFATQLVSFFFFRTQRSAAARRCGGLKKGGAVYTVSARDPALSWKKTRREGTAL